MRVIPVLETCPKVKKILEHLDPWHERNHDPPTKNESNIPELVRDNSDYQISQYRYLGLNPRPSARARPAHI